MGEEYKMMLHLIDEGEGKFLFKKTFDDNYGIVNCLAEWKIPENMNFDSGRFPCRIENLIDMQIMAIKQGETAIRRLPLRKDILDKLLKIKDDVKSVDSVQEKGK